MYQETSRESEVFSLLGEMDIVSCLGSSHPERVLIRLRVKPTHVVCLLAIALLLGDVLMSTMLRHVTFVFYMFFWCKVGVGVAAFAPSCRVLRYQSRVRNPSYVTVE